MSGDLISREALIKKIFPYGMPDDGNYPINAKAVRKAIEESQEQIIRCKDCKHSEDRHSKFDVLWCRIWCDNTPVDGYCHEGE